MEFKDLDPKIQDWLDSDEFINSIVAIQEKFKLDNSLPLIKVINEVVLKKINFSETEETLGNLIPNNSQVSEIASEIVNKILSPIKEPLQKSSINISMITPIEKVSFKPQAPEQPRQESNISPISPITSVNNQQTPISKESPLSESTPKTQLLINSQPEKNTPQKNEVIINQEKLPTENNNPLIKKINEKKHPETITPSFEKDDIKKDPAPFVIHEEKFPQKASGNNDNKNPLRPIFYSENSKEKEKASFVNLEFGSTQKNNVDPDNIVDLKDLPL